MSSLAAPKLAIRKAALWEVVMVKFISAVIAAAAFAGVMTLLWATGTRLDARSAGDAAPQSTPVTETAPALAAAAISPELVRLEVARDLAVMRNSIEQLAAKQEQMAQNIATLQAAEQDIRQNIATLQAAEKDIIQTRSSPPLSGPVSPPPRKKARRVAPRELAAQASSVSPPTFRPQ
jgi:TolA-binding protein